MMIDVDQFGPFTLGHLAWEAYDRVWQFKWMPPGRGLLAMGTVSLLPT